MKTTQSALAYIICGCIFGLISIGMASFFLTPHDPTIVTKIIESLGGIVLMAGGAKAGLSLPNSDSESSQNKKDLLSISSSSSEDTEAK